MTNHSKIEDKDLYQITLERLNNKADEITAVNRTDLDKANRHTNIGNGSIIVIYLAGVAFLVNMRLWDTAMFLLVSSLWVVFVWILSREINEQRYIINTQQDLRKLENNQLLESLGELDKAAKGKK